MQCAPLLAAPHAGSVLATMTGAPTCGQAGGATGPASVVPVVPVCDSSFITQRFAGALFCVPIAHAPVGLLSLGFVHGAQRSSSAHPVFGRMSWFSATSGTHVLRQTPGAAPSDVHDGGYAPPLRMSASGRQ
jgi:hypothetical protein